ncbi:MAG: AbrB/MazE/SpoVT family DNA-binding domain-containing protein [Methylococcus sp.]|nr:AbrB/MazE/SpoVT family DNA-binding domain-containing protein [Methylococcus sp.]
MQLIVKKWGNSASIRIPAAIMEAAHLKLDDPVDVREENGRIIIEPLAHKTYELDALLVGITPGNLHSEVDTGSAVGNEAW